MTIKCLIIDDEPLAIQIIERHVAQMPNMELVATFQSPLEAFELLKTEAIDLIFLDIEMPLLTGIDLVKALSQPPSIIFTTAYRNYAFESYELNVVDYLLKPITFTRFFKAVNKYKSLHQESTSPELPELHTPVHDHLYVNINKKYVKILFEDILYVESLKDYIRIHTTREKMVTKDRIGAFEKKLPSTFLRIHRSFIVNTAKISAFTAKDVELGRLEIPIGERYKKGVLGFLRDF